MLARYTLVTLSITAALSASLQDARAEYPDYVGMGILVGGSGKFTNSVTRANSDNDVSGISLKTGYITASGSRLELSYSAINLAFPAVTRRISGLDLSYLWTFGAKPLKPYAGLGFGMHRFEDSTRSVVDNTSLAAVAFSFSGGVIYDLTPRIDVQAALLYKTFEAQETQRGSRTTGTWTQKLTSAYVAANYHF
jgi:opacity protein-like surface antigen